MERDADNERAALIATLRTAVPGASDEATKLSEMAARFGENRAVDRQSIAAVLDELERLEGDVQRMLSEGGDALALATPYRVHELCAAMRREALRAFGRTARHDAVNAIGAARNAVLLIAEDRATDDRRRFVEIAKRNLHLAERLVRSLFADEELAEGSGPSAAVAKLHGDQRRDLRRAGEGDHLDAGSL